MYWSFMYAGRHPYTVHSQSHWVNYYYRARGKLKNVQFQWTNNFEITKVFVFLIYSLLPFRTMDIVHISRLKWNHFCYIRLKRIYFLVEASHFNWKHFEFFKWFSKKVCISAFPSMFVQLLLFPCAFIFRFMV